MKVDAFEGYITYRNKEHFFIFENYLLRIIPCTLENLLECKSTFCFERLSEPKKGGWINQLQFDAIRLDGKSVIFSVQDSPSLKDGVFSYKVNWFYINESSFNDIKIKGINFLSQEIDYLYTIKKYVTDDFSLDNGRYKEYQINIKASNPELLGSFRFSNYGIKIFGDMSFRAKYCSNEKLEVWSKLILESSRELDDLNKLYRLVILQLNVINLLSYRKNNTFELIETYSYDENMNKCITGKFYFKNDCAPEKDFDVIQSLISYADIPNIGGLYQMILGGKIYLSHICANSFERKIYSPSRMLGIMIAFERMFTWQYGVSAIRSQDYLELLDRVKDYLERGQDEICNELQVKGKFKKIVKRLSEPQVSYGNFISHVIHSIPICESYVKNMYDFDKLTDIVNKISERINKLRNDMAHGNIDVELTIEHTKDLKLLEIIIYIMIFSHLNVEDKQIVSKINWLFNIKSFKL